MAAARQYKTDDKGDIVFLDESRQLDASIRYIDPDSKKSHVVVLIYAHGSVKRDNPIPPEYTDSTLMLSTAVIGLYAFDPKHKLNLEYDDEDNTNHIGSISWDSIDTIRDYSHNLLTKNYRILDVLNSLRQRIVRNKMPESYAIEHPDDILPQMHNNPIIHAKHEIRKITALIKRDPEEDNVENRNIKDNARIEINLTKQNKFAYLHVPEFNSEYQSDPIQDYDSSEGQDISQFNIRIEVLDVRYPKNRRQQRLLSPENHNILAREWCNVIRDDISGDWVAETNLTSILIRLKNRFDFDYITIIETTCRINEVGFDGEDLTKDQKQRRFVEVFNRKRVNMKNFLKKHNYRSFGGRRTRRRVAQMSRNYIMPKTARRSAPQVAMAAMEHVFAMRDGKVLADVKKTVSDGILKVRGFVNNKRINTTKKLKGGRKRGTRRARRTRRRRHTY